MMILVLILISAVLSAVLTAFARGRGGVVRACSLFYVVQFAAAVGVVVFYRGGESLTFFTFDNLGIMFHLLLAVISPIVFYQSTAYLDTESLREFKIYNAALVALCVSATGVYYANNAAVTWIFLEATTLATAALVYHRRSIRSLEATWKYIFVSSVGIAIAYLGILMLSTAVAGGEGLSYANLARSVATANPLYLKLAFLFILAGYSCKMEIFPLFTVGVDANYAAPTPASALISSALVNAGFVAFFRIYRVIAVSEVYSWACNVLIIVGVISVLVGAVYLRRTNNYKRFLTYSTVENLGIAMIGLGIGGVGVFAALFHVLGHSLIKSGMFLQIAQVGRIYGTYRMNRSGRYSAVYKTGAVAVLMGMTGLLAFPPSALFLSELLVFKEIILAGRWTLLVILVLLLCLIVYTLCRRFVSLVFKEVDVSRVDMWSIDRTATSLQIGLLAAAMILGIVRPGFIVEFINGML